MSDSFNLFWLIDKILEDSHLFQSVLKESYYHENGFHKIVLLSGPYFKLRVHHFGAGVKIPMENIHDHRWPFASSILSGQLRMDMFREWNTMGSGEKLYHFIYNSDKSTGSYKTNFKGIKFIEKTKSRSFGRWSGLFNEP